MPRYDLEVRTYRFAVSCRDFTEALPKSIQNMEYAKQLIRASASPAANYIEANESLSEKDFVLKIRICIKEAKESALWLGLCKCEENDALSARKQSLIRESGELRKIFGAILRKARDKIPKHK